MRQLQSRLIIYNDARKIYNLLDDLRKESW
jgi:hypothetical protein